MKNIEAAVMRLRERNPGPRVRAVWPGDDGSIRIGRSGDVVQMLDDLRIPSSIYLPEF